MQSDNQRSPHLTTNPISLGVDRLQDLQPVSRIASRISRDGVGLETVQADLTCLLTVIKNKRRWDGLRIVDIMRDLESVVGGDV